MLITTKRPTGWQITARAWASLFAAIPAMAPLFLTSLLLKGALSFAGAYVFTHLTSGVKEFTLYAIKQGPAPPVGGMVLYSGISLVFDILSAIVIAPLAVAMHRFILLGEAQKTFFFLSSAALRFAAWLIVFDLPLGLFPLAGPHHLISTVLIVVNYVGLVWTLLLFPAVAVGDPSYSLSGRLRAARKRATGNFWLIARAMILTLGPPVLVFALIEMTRGNPFAEAPDPAAQLAHLMSWPIMLSGIVGGILMTGLGAAAASWLYSYAISKN